MTNFLLVFIGILIGLLIQAALDYKMLDDMDRELETIQENFEAFVQKMQEGKDDGV